MCPLDLDGVNLVILELLYHYYISVSKCAMFGQFSGPCFIVRPPNFNSFYWSPKCWGKNWKHFEEEHANEEKEQIEKDEHDEDNPSRELDDFIVAETLWNTMKKDSKRYL